MLELFLKGGPVMWPLLATSLVTLSVVIERLLFVTRLGGAVAAGLRSAAPRRVLLELERVCQAARHRIELKRWNRGLSVLDTAVTLAPLLGLLGTVTGMIHAFGLLGGHELDAPAAVTGGIAGELIVTALGIRMDILAQIHFRFLICSFV